MCPALVRGAARCPDHQRQQQRDRERSRDRASSTQRGYGYRWQTTAQQLVRAEPWCHAPGCYATSGLTVDHIVPKARGGTDDPSNLTVLCRPCNSAKRDR